MIVAAKQDYVSTIGYAATTKTLTKGKKYFVYALEETTKRKDYFILDDTHEEYPISYKSEYFEIVDQSIPTYWVKVAWGISIFRHMFSSFPEWAEHTGRHGERGFYELLIDGNKQCQDVFRGYVQDA